MSDNNPYQSPQSQEESLEMGEITNRSWPVHRVAVVNLILGTLGIICTGLNVLSMIIEKLTFNVPGADVLIHDTYVVSVVARVDQ